MIYFDSAATTLQKPEAVAAATARAIRTLSSPGRGGYPAAMRASETVLQCREELAALLHVPEPEQVVFTCNATHGLNIAIKSMITRGERVLISGYEHNAVTRVLHGCPGVELCVARAPLFRPDLALEAFERELAGGVDLAICNHVSNVFGFVQPIYEIGGLCRRYGVPFIVDASQSAGILPVDFIRSQAEFMAMPGHKGLYGPQGTGVLLCRGEDCVPLLEGGTGSESINQTMPGFLPDRLEAGTHNVAGVAGLLEGVRYVRRMGTERILRHERGLGKLLSQQLSGFPELQVFDSETGEAQSGVVSFRHGKMSCEELGEKLGERGVAVRTGLHCAPLAHQTAGTLETGTVRVSFSSFNRVDEVYRFTSLLEQICK